MDSQVPQPGHATSVVQIVRDRRQDALPCDTEMQVSWSKLRIMKSVPDDEADQKQAKHLFK